jgi:hypothetical protein
MQENLDIICPFKGFKPFSVYVFSESGIIILCCSLKDLSWHKTLPFISFLFPFAYCFFFFFFQKLYRLQILLVAPSVGGDILII